jgi:hypothetical protein
MKLIIKSGLLAAMMFALVGASPAHAIFGQVGAASGCKAGKAKCVTKMKSCLLALSEGLWQGSPSRPGVSRQVSHRFPRRSRDRQGLHGEARSQERELRPDRR